MIQLILIIRIIYLLSCRFYAMIIIFLLSIVVIFFSLVLSFLIGSCQKSLVTIDNDCEGGN